MGIETAILPAVEPAIFIDRDNTLIHNDGDLGDPNEVTLIDNVGSGLRALREAGYRIVVVTNQGGVARGKFTEADVDAVHQRIAVLVDQAAKRPRVIDRFYYCPYHPEAEVKAYRRDHPWRKPNPGMLIQAAHDLGLELTASWMIGDQSRDVSSGRAAGCQTILITTDEERARDAHASVTVESFTEAVGHILNESSNHGSLLSNGVAQKSENGSPISILSAAPPNPQTNSRQLFQAIQDLTEEIRSERLRRIEFTSLKMAAGVGQLFVVLLTLLGLLQLQNTDIFMKWIVCAVLAQLVTIALLLLDMKG